MKKFIFLTILILIPTMANAQPKLIDTLTPVTSSSCDPITILKGITPQNFQARVKTCGDEDLTNSIAAANVPPLNFTALGCLTGIKVLRDAVVKGGVLTMFEAYGRAKSQGLITNCTNWVLTTVAP